MNKVCLFMIITLGLTSCKKFKEEVKITTDKYENVTSTTARLTGTIVDLGEAGISDYGFCWAKTKSPTVKNDTNSLGRANVTGKFAITITDLEPGTTYFFNTYAISNDVIYGEELSFTTLLDAPTNVSATAGNGQATVTFTAPANNGGSTITGYRVTSNPGSIIVTGSASPITIPGLSNGTAYTFTVVAINVNGPGNASLPSNSVTPSGVPGSPTNVSATAGNGQATVTFTAPANNGGSTITGYRVTSNPGSVIVTGSANPITITGLTNGTVYTFTVVAINVNGSGTASLPSNSVTPSGVPGSPTNVTATAGNGQATVTFTAPANNGGSTITGYRVTSNPGSIIVTGAASPITIPGLTNGTAYTFTVIAINVNGSGTASLPSNSIRPLDPTLLYDIELNEYNIVRIGSQVWMAENLKTTKYNDGSDIPRVDNYAEWSYLSTSGYCWYNNAELTNKNLYGALYNWFAVNTGKLCPLGWHVPSDSEWTELTTYLGYEFIAGGKLKTTGTIEEGTGLWHSPNAAATNDNLFSALPGGARSPDGTFYNINFYAYWWSYSEYSVDYAAWARSISYEWSNCFRSQDDKNFGFSVRCIKD